MRKLFALVFGSILILSNLATATIAQAGEQYDYYIQAKSDDAEVRAGDSVILWTKIQNTGYASWDDYYHPIHLGTTDPRDRYSMLYSYDKWISFNRIILTEKNYNTYTFAFTANIPTTTTNGTYRECFYPVLENLSWIEKEPICWNIHVTGNSNNYRAEIVPGMDYYYLDLKANEEKQIEFAVKNTGTVGWNRSAIFPVHLATTRPKDRSSNVYNDSWLNYNRPAELTEDYVSPGAIGHFKFTIKAPASLNSTFFTEKFWLVAENLQWFEEPGSLAPVLTIAVNYENDQNNSDSFSQKYSDIEIDSDEILSDGKDEQTIEVTLKDKNDDPIKNEWITLLGREIDVYDLSYDYFDYTIKTDSNGKAKYDFTTKTVADYEFSFKYNSQEFEDWVEFSSIDKDFDENKDFSDDYSDVYVNKSYIEADGDDEARIDITIKDHNNNPIKNKRFELIVMEKETDEDGYNEDSYNLTTDSNGRATKYFTTRHEADFRFSFEYQNDRFRYWGKLKSYEDNNNSDNDFDPDNSYIRANRTRIKGDGTDYALVEIGVHDEGNDPIENQKVLLTGERCDTDGNNCRDIDDVVVYTDNSGVAEYKYRYDGEANFEVTYEIDGERSKQYTNFEFYTTDHDDDDDYDVDNNYEVPILSLSYIPVDNNDVDIDVMKDWKDRSLNNLRDYIDESNKDLIYYLEQGSTYHGYKDSGADPALDYYLVDDQEFLQELPVSNKYYWDNTGNRMIDYYDILDNDIDVCDYVDNDRVKEVWIWAYAPEDEEPVGWESNMMMGTDIDGEWNYSTYGNVSNSYRQKDMPICKNTYTAYTYNFGREVGMALEDHTHQIEAVLNYVDGRDNTGSSDWDDLLFWGKFVGSDSTNKIINPGCGWTHYPPNGKYDYDWKNTTEVKSGCANWEPDGGYKELVSCKTWGGSNCDKYDEDGANVAFLVWWMQNIPGLDNDLYDGNDKIKNWWDFIGDFDEHIGDQSLTY